MRVFVPILLEQDEGHVMNTASAAGLVAFPFAAPYGISKFGVVALSEALAAELEAARANVKVSVLCPAYVATRIAETRNLPPELAAEYAAAGPPSPAVKKRLEDIARGVAAGMPPEQIAGAVFAAIRDERFYILTHDEMRPLIEARMRAVLEGGAPPRIGAS
ncbi:MAG TPA: hypothetical protein DEH78_33170 [Solibacterales bacterium]|nr:hypothetical protein [Bryobacterales bacterium]